jgi:TATA-box binding protein (TBP) (component of TFIID and TFIIIB)
LANIREKIQGSDDDLVKEIQIYSDPARFAAGVRLQHTSGRVTDKVTLFGSGKMTTHRKHTEDAKRAFKKFALVLRKIGYSDAAFTALTSTTYSANGKLGFFVNLTEWSPKSGAMFEPEIDTEPPGATLEWPSADDKRCTATVFASGKVRFQGAKTEEAIQECFQYLMVNCKLP